MPGDVSTKAWLRIAGPLDASSGFNAIGAAGLIRWDSGDRPPTCYNLVWLVVNGDSMVMNEYEWLLMDY